MTREESIKHFEQQQKRYKREHDGTECPHYTNAIKALQEPERIHGHWIYDHWCEFKCSECGAWSKSKPYKGREPFCSECGAIMDEAKE